MAQNHIDHLMAGVTGFKMEHGILPSFILLTTDVFRAISREIEMNPSKYKGVVDVRGSDIKVMDVMVAQLPGHNRVELVIDPLVYKSKFVL